MGKKETELGVRINDDQRQVDLERMLDHQIKMLHTLQEQCQNELRDSQQDKVVGKQYAYADKGVLAKMTQVTGMLSVAAKTKTDLARAYEKLNASLTPEQRIKGMLKYLKAQPGSIRRAFILALSEAHEQQKAAVNNGSRGTAVDSVVAALKNEPLPIDESESETDVIFSQAVDPDE